MNSASLSTWCQLGGQGPVHTPLCKLGPRAGTVITLLSLGSASCCPEWGWLDLGREVGKGFKGSPYTLLVHYSGFCWECEVCLAVKSTE